MNLNQNNGYQQQNYQQTGYQQQNYQQNDYLNYPQSKPQGNMNSGSVTPKTGWSWGAAFLSIWWGIGNGCYLPLLGLLPILNIFWWIVCGLKGHQWAMNSGMFRTVEEYNAAQKTWDRAGFVMFIFTIIMVVGVILWGSFIVTAILSSLNDINYY